VRSALLTAILLASCGPALTQEQKTVQVAYDHARERFGDSSNPNYWLPPQKVEDHGHYWLIKFARGGPWVEVRKSDLKVLGSIAFQ
jgi:hypothetical protein